MILLNQVKREKGICKNETNKGSEKAKRIRDIILI